MSEEASTRAGQKLLGALRAFSVDLRGKTVLDIGSSTGGFTELALRRGAARVIAVEKGTGQMRGATAMDARVELHEKTDIFEFVPDVQVDVILADVSFVSLRKVLRYAGEKLAGKGTELLVMLKPQFEVGEDKLVKGVLKNSKMRREAIASFEGWLKNNRFVVKGKRDNDMIGRFGNRERFYYLCYDKSK